MSRSNPWYAIPADRKWCRDLVVADIPYRTLKGLDMQYPGSILIRRIS